MSDSNSNEPKNLILDDEKSVLLDHNYDGIQELDQPLPGWWLMTFYGAIIFAVVYFIYFHMGGPGLKQAEELKQDLAQYQKSGGTPAASVDWQKYLDQKSVIDKGAQTFATTCASCHAPKAEGLVGPNLTDSFWIHGKGTPDDILHIIKVGVPEKGMLAWDSLLKEEDQRNLVAFIVSIKGTMVGKGKAPQGEKYE